MMCAINAKVHQKNHESKLTEAALIGGFLWSMKNARRGQKA